MSETTEGQRLVLPWPPSVLSPNARAHWTKRHKAAKSYRGDCYLLCKQAGITAPAGRIRLLLEFIPPDRRSRDDDNLVAAFKAGRDGLADALGVDDSRFSMEVRLSSRTVKGGAVEVQFRGL